MWTTPLSVLASLDPDAVRAIPDELLAGPFTVRQAAALGVTARQLQGARWLQLVHGVYAHGRLPLTLEVRARAVSLVLPMGSVVGGATAAWLHGVDIRRGDDLTVDVIVPRETQIRRRGVRARAALLEPGDVDQLHDVPVTSPVRTGFDLARGRDLVDAVVAVDALLNRGLCRLEDLLTYTGCHREWVFVRWADEVLGHAEPLAESPMESRQRMALVLAGLPRPVAQLNLFDGPSFVARLDLGYERYRVAPEYDGEPHQDRWREDNERQQRIRELGWWHRRYTLIDYRGGWQRMLAEVHAALLAAGWRGEPVGPPPPPAARPPHLRRSCRNQRF